MKILQTIRTGDMLYVFTDNVYEDIKYFNNKYENRDYNVVHLGCEAPEIFEYEFLGKKHPCISMWYDYQECICKESEIYFNKQIKLGKNY